MDSESSHRSETNQKMTKRVVVKVKRDANKNKKSQMLQQINTQNYLLKQFEQEESDMKLQMMSNQMDNFSTNSLFNEKLIPKVERHDSDL